MRRSRPAVLVLLVAMAATLAVAGCLASEAAALAYGGREYLGVDGSVFAIDPAALTDVGRPDRINSPGTDGRIYALTGVPSPDAVVTRGPGDELTVFVVRIDGGLTIAPLGEAVPKLCPYLVDAAREGCPAR